MDANDNPDAKSDPPLTYHGTHYHAPGPVFPDPQPGVGATDAVTTTHYAVAVLDAHGDLVASGIALVAKPTPSDPIYTIRFTDFITPKRPGELLPVRAEPEPQPEPLPLGQSVSFRHAKDGSLIDTTYTVSHSHPHDHAYGGGADGYTESHSHAHTHSDHDSFRSTIYGHTLDPHAHDH